MTDAKLTTGNLVWFITGCSTGFGRHLAKQVLECGDQAVITARKPEDLKEFSASGRALILKLDVTDRKQIEAAVKAAHARFGRIDVLVNNAGIGYFGSVEESEEDQVRWMFDINVFGLGNMTKEVLPIMRAQRSGCIVNISSLAGLRPIGGLGYYCATKFAVEALSGALGQEVKPLGINVIAVEPSGFRTDWAGRSANESPHQIADYAATAGVKISQVRAASGKQPGDPLLAAKAIIAAVKSPNPPCHMPLGNTSFDAGTAGLESLLKELRAGEAVARAADAPIE